MLEHSKEKASAAGKHTLRDRRFQARARMRPAAASFWAGTGWPPCARLGVAGGRLPDSALMASSVTMFDLSLHSHALRVVFF